MIPLEPTDGGILLTLVLAYAFLAWRYLCLQREVNFYRDRDRAARHQED